MTDTDPIYAALDVALEGEDLYPIREVSRLTGVNPVTLRAWERRYGLLVPHRTESGHRLYSMADIERVRKVTAWIDRGVAVSKVGSIIDREVAASRAPGIEDDSRGSAASASCLEWQTKLLEAVNSCDLARLEAVYGRIHSTFPLATVLRDIALPVWKLLLEKTEGHVASCQWSILDAFLRGRLFQRISYLRPGLPTVLMAALPGSGSEFEILSAAALVSEANANITYVPAVDSFAELAAMAERSGCEVLMLYGDRALDAQAFNRGLPLMEQSLVCKVVAIGPVCEVQPVELERSGITALGLPGPELVNKVRNLLMGRLDSQ